MATTTLKASCLCGAGKHEITLPTSELPLTLGICHCASCRRMTGTMHLTTVPLPESYSPTKDLLGKLTQYQFSKRITEYFCSTCGTHMLAYVAHSAHDENSNDRWDVMAGTLENVNDMFEIEAHDFLEDTLDGGFADFFPSFKGKPVPRFAKFTDKSEELPLYWYSPTRPQIEPSLSDRLHGHCKCGGVNFWLARPSERSKNALDKSAWWLRDNGKKFLASVCSCNSCRLDCGMEWIEWAFVPTIDITLDAEGNVPFALPFGSLKAYRSFHDVKRYHCGTCGATVFYTTDDRVDLVDVAVGLLDAPEGARAESWLEWRLQQLSFREDGLARAKDLTLAVENGLEEFKKRHEK